MKDLRDFLIILGLLVLICFCTDSLMGNSRILSHALNPLAYVTMQHI